MISSGTVCRGPSFSTARSPSILLAPRPVCAPKLPYGCRRISTACSRFLHSTPLVASLCGRAVCIFSVRCDAPLRRSAHRLFFLCSVLGVRESPRSWSLGRMVASACITGYVRDPSIISLLRYCLHPPHSCQCSLCSGLAGHAPSTRTVATAPRMASDDRARRSCARSKRERAELESPKSSFTGFMLCS